GSGFDFTVAKFDSGGGLLWQRSLNGTANATDSAQAVAVDGQGNVVAAGFSENTGTGFDFTVAKFRAADGALLWKGTLNGSANGFDQAQSVAVDPQGNVVAAGF